MMLSVWPFANGTSLKKRLKLMAFLCCMVCPLILTSATVWGQQSAPDKGGLFLVSTGSGDADNMTIRAHKTIMAADILFSMHPQQTREQLGELVKGKTMYAAGHGLFGKHARRGDPQELKAREDQARKVIRKAVAAGKSVVLLDSGDPTIYGPQTGYLREFADLNPQVIPGISSFNAANAALRRGITEGKNSRSVILTAAMGARKKYKGNDTLAKLAETRSTMVFFTMGLDLSAVVQQLKSSYSGDTPIAIVLYAGYADKEKVLQATLDTIVTKLGMDRLPFEHLIYVGDFLR